MKDNKGEYKFKQDAPDDNYYSKRYDYDDYTTECELKNLIKNGKEIEGYCKGNKYTKKIREVNYINGKKEGKGYMIEWSKTLLNYKNDLLDGEITKLEEYEYENTLQDKYTACKGEKVGRRLVYSEDKLFSVYEYLYGIESVKYEYDNNKIVKYELYYRE